MTVKPSPPPNRETEFALSPCDKRLRSASSPKLAPVNHGPHMNPNSRVGGSEEELHFSDEGEKGGKENECAKRETLHVEAEGRGASDPGRSTC